MCRPTRSIGVRNSSRQFRTTFEWLKSPSVVIKLVDAIAVYANAQGDIVIRQKSSKGIFREEDSIVVVPRDRLDVVLSNFQREQARKPVAAVPKDELINHQRQA